MNEQNRMTKKNDKSRSISNDLYCEDVPRLIELPEGLTLTNGTMELRADFTRMVPRINPNKVHQELLVKAAKIKGAPTEDLLVVDATAGLGEDSLLLAAAGFSVVMFERDKTIAALLEDGLARAAHD